MSDRWSWHPIGLVVALMLSLHPGASAQVAHVKEFGPAEGLSSPYVTDLLATSDGHIYLATAGGGVYRYDGRTFHSFSADHAPGSLYFEALYQGADGTVWAGGEQTLAWWQQGRWQHRHLPGFDISAMGSKNDTTLFLAGPQGLLAFSCTSKSPSSESLHDGPWYALAERGEEVLLGGEDALLHWSGSEWTEYGRARGVPSGSYVGLTAGADHDFLVATEDGRNFRLSPARGLLPGVGPVPGEVTFLTSHRSKLLAGTRQRGLLTWEPEQSAWRPYLTQAQSFYHGTDVAFDAWGNTWIGTAKMGLLQYTHRHFMHLTPEAGLSGRYVNQLGRTAAGTITVLYNNGSFDLLSPGGVSQGFSGLPFGTRVIAISHGHRGAWLASSQGLAHLHDSTTTQFSSGEPWNVGLLDVEAQSDEACLVLTREGLWALEFTADSMGLDLEDYRLLAPGDWRHLSADQQGRYWVWGPSGLGFVTTRTALQTIDLPDRWQIWCMVAGGQGPPLFGTRDQGIYHLVERSDTLFLSPLLGNDRLPSPHIHSMTLDRDGQLWVATSAGVFRGVLDGGISLEDGQTLDVHAGLPPISFSQGAAVVDDQGRVVFGTSEGVLQIETSPPMDSVRAPQLSLLHATIGDQAIFDTAPASLAQLAHLPYQERHVSVALLAIDQAYPQGIEYAWKLEDYHDDWRTSSSNQIELVAVPQGRHTLLAKATNRMGQSSNLLRIPFHIIAPWWKSIWVPILSLALAVLLIFLLYRWNVYRILKRSERREQALRLKNELLTLEQKALRLQMNPHFIFNALQSIQAKISAGKNQGARQDLQRFAALMRSYLYQSRQDRISLEDEIKGLTRYLRIEQGIRDNFDFEIIVPEDVDPSFYEIPPMLIQPYVENAVKHGISRADSRGHICVEFAWMGKYLQCVIADNGPGFSAGNGNKDHRSTGMEVTRDRITSYFAHLKQTPVLTEDLKDAQGGVRGARVRIIIPTEGP